ncbi:hypothetical protein VV01_18885 [Luteipulveratus halotolerans]|uniref:Uncharacterized protein n=1 Tax=Luteipulveratus halotolerans TaxID=1631356 RepID=A0A0L6CMG9_9MICO|nr:hypothetical protein VV01_18885 [Luteipulveratus halotolerans]
MAVLGTLLAGSVGAGVVQHQQAEAAGGAFAADFVPGERGPDNHPIEQPEPVRDPVCRPGKTQPTGGMTPGEIEVKFPTEVAPSGPSGTPGKASGSVSAALIGQATIDPAQLEGDGTETQKASISVDERLTVEGKAQLRKVDVKGEVYTGNKVTYSVQSQAGKLADNLAPPPNPLDPGAMPKGTAVGLDQQYYVGAGLTASYEGIVGSNEYAVGDGVTTSITKTDDKTVRVLYGPADFVSSPTFLGIGTLDYNIGFLDNRTLVDKHVVQAEFDISTPEGKDGYYRMVFAGTAPQQDGPGISNVSDVMGLEYARRNGIQVQAGDVKGSATQSGEDLSYMVTRYADGRQIDDVSYRIDDNTMVRHDVYQSNGERDIDASTYQLRLRNSDATALQVYNKHYGGNDMTPVTTNQNFVLELSPREFGTMRWNATSILRDRVVAQGDWPYDPELQRSPNNADVDAWIERMYREDKRYRVEGLAADPDARNALAIHDAPNDMSILRLMWKGSGGHWSPFGSLDWLGSWNIAVAKHFGGDETHQGVGNAICVKPAGVPD